jgi:hypothetical protein
MLAPAAVAQTASEYQVKAAFLFNFAKFVGWPADTFKSPSEPFHICVFGPGIVANTLAEIGSRETVNGRPLAVTIVTKEEETHSCQILFVGALSRSKARPMLDELRSKSVLTVGESAGFALDGGIVNFKVQDGRVRFEINPKAAEQAHLQISSRLLSLAQIVTGNR